MRSTKTLAALLSTSIAVAICALLVQLFACSNALQSSKKSSQRFSNHTLPFSNELQVNDTMNYFQYGYFYMGGGVATGDLNGDNRPDVFLTANMGDDKLLLNHGELNLVDCTDAAGIHSSEKWHTGCAFTDINADGLLDIYVSVSGNWTDRANLLYINTGNDENGVPQFCESAQEFGLDDRGYSIQAAFLDYDQDGDIDVYVANYPKTPLDLKTPAYIKLVSEPNLESSDHLYRNNGDNTFTDVTEQAGLMAFGLAIGVVAADFNNDHLTDLYVSNDFQTPDFLYLNTGDGTFVNALDNCFRHTSFFGMGVDAADFNNDLLPDLVQVDMSTNDNYRSKANMASMDVPGFEMMTNSSLGHQYMYNSLQVHNGFDPEGYPFFSDIAMHNNLHATEWSWACLFADLDNDGWKDLYISNGTRKDINNKDYFNWLKRTDTSMKIRYKELDVHELTKRMPSIKIDNEVYRNEAGSFVKANEEWNLSFKGYSNGLSYADLDADGDLDLICNNIDTLAMLFVNRSEQFENNHLQIQLKGPKLNPLALGTKVFVFSDSLQQFQELSLCRGYQSSVQAMLHFGLGKQEHVDSIVVRWPDGKITRSYDVPINKSLEISYKDSHLADLNLQQEQLPQFTPAKAAPFHFEHKENHFNDYEREVLLPHKMSGLGPALSSADINRDGIPDVFLGGAKQQDSRLFLSKPGEQFLELALSSAEHEENDALFHDIDGDGDLDLLVASGGSEYNELSNTYYSQHYYLNQGEGRFSVAQYFEPRIQMSASVVREIDLDGDGHSELFFGGRQLPGKYPAPASSYLLRKGKNISKEYAPVLKEIGMVTDAIVLDFDGDMDEDMIIVGEWMGITILENHNGQLREKHMKGISDQVGWWQTIHAGDFDADNDIDLVIGNLGNNYKYRASEQEPFELYFGDFDENDKLDIVLSCSQDGEKYPLRGRQCSSAQMPELLDRFPNYHAFASSNLHQIYGKEKLEAGTRYAVNNFKHLLLKNENGSFVAKELPAEFQKYCIKAIASRDINGDQKPDLVMAGNHLQSEAETPRNDACYGILALGDGNCNFNIVPAVESGLYIPYETSALSFISDGTSEFLLAANNNAPAQIFKLINPKIPLIK